jgi:hypothetical protein
MLNILHGLCEANNLFVHEFENSLEGVNSKIAVPSVGNTNQEYYFILDCDSADDAFLEILANEHAEKFMETLEELEFTDESVRKNSTLILCCEAGNITDHALLKFEEDPYYFKKNVITYSKGELLALKGEINNGFSNDHLNTLLMSNSGELFESFKTLSLEADHYYPLLVRVITTLPFVHYLPQPNQLSDLDAFVRNELDKIDLNLLDLICVDGEKLSIELINAKISSTWGEL